MLHRTLVIILVMLLGYTSSALAANTLGSRDIKGSLQQHLGAALTPYVFSGCAPVVPASSLTIVAFACTAFVEEGSTPPKFIPVVQAVAAVTVPDSAVVWLAIHQRRQGQGAPAAPSGWTGVSGTHYLTQAAANQPADPSGGFVFAKVTVAASVITVVDDLGYRSPLAAQTKVHEVLDFVTGGNGSVASPYTGWDATIPWAEGVAVHFGGPAVYAYSTQPAWSFDSIHIRCDGETTLQFTGTGPVMFLDGGSTGSGADLTIDRFLLDGCILNGNANSTYTLRLNGVTRSLINFETGPFQDNTSPALFCEGCILVHFNEVLISSVLIPWTEEPLTGVSLDQKSGIGGTTASLFTNLVVESLTTVGGSCIHLVEANSNVFNGGTAETCQTAVTIDAASLRNSFNRVFTEGSSVANYDITGQVNELNGLTVTAGTTFFRSGATRNVIRGGQFTGAVTFDSGANDNLLTGVRIDGTITDNGSFNERRFIDNSGRQPDQIDQIDGIGSTVLTLGNDGDGIAIGGSITNRGTITRHLSLLVTNLTSASILANVCATYGTISYTTAAVGDIVIATPDAVSSADGIEDNNLSYYAYVSAAGTVLIRACNLTGSTITPSNDQEWRIDIWQH